MTAPVHLPVWVRPGNSRDAPAWDPWRRCWVVRCRAAPESGSANDAVLGLIARWLSLPPSEVRWVRAGTSRSKIVEVRGLSRPEIDRRLHAAGIDPAGDPDAARTPPEG